MLTREGHFAGFQLDNSDPSNRVETIAYPQAFKRGVFEDGLKSRSPFHTLMSSKFYRSPQSPGLGSLSSENNQAGRSTCGGEISGR
jgi:hypothetical protein